MKSYNNVTLVGRSVRKPEHKKFDDSDSKQRCTFTLAVDRPYKDDDGKHPTDFLLVVAWGNLIASKRSKVVRPTRGNCDWMFWRRSVRAERLM